MQTIISIHLHKLTLIKDYLDIETLTCNYLAEGNHASWKGRYKNWAMDEGAHPWLVDEDEEVDQEDIPIPITLILTSVFVYICKYQYPSWYWSNT